MTKIRMNELRFKIENTDLQENTKLFILVFVAVFYC